MPTMHELSRWIRDHGQDARHLPRLMANRFVWHQLWTAMDIIDDIDWAMTSYLKSDFPGDVGEQYLRIYGAMQGLFLQQDALLDLIRAIHPAKNIQLNDVLKDIREARNASVGHPTQLRRKGALSTHGIVRDSMRKDGFQLLSYPGEEDGRVFRYIAVRELIEKQRAEAVRILTEVVEDLREQEQAHRLQFQEVKLVSGFDQVSYAFEKLSEELRPNSLNVLSGWAADHLRKALDDFDARLKERGLSVDAYDSIEYLYGEVEHPLTELTKFVKREPSEVQSKQTASVFITALRNLFDELRTIAREIDEEYTSEPKAVGDR